MKIIQFEERYRQDFIAMNTSWIIDYFQNLEPQDMNTFEKIDEDLKRGGMIFFAVKDDTALATCMAKPLEGSTWEICKLASNKNRSHSGAGSAVFREAMQWAIDHRAKRLFIISNRVLKPALHIYEKMGFQEVQLENYEYERGDIAFEYIVEK